HYPGAFGGAEYLPGAVDQLRIYARALPAAEVAQLYADTRPAVSLSRQGLVAWFKFDEGAGTTAADSSGSGNAGSLIGGPTWTAGTSGKAVALDGVNDFVRIAHRASLDAFPLTAAVWFKTTTASGTPGLINKYLPSSRGGYQLFFNNGTLCAWYFRNTSNYVYDASGGGCTLSTPGLN